MKIRCEDGSLSSVAHGIRAQIGETALCLARGMTEEYVPLDGSRALTQGDRDTLVNRGDLQAERSLLFSNPQLCASVFAWGASDEIEFIEKAMNGRVSLDVGCGYGRLLIPLANKNNHIDGIDISINNAQYIKTKIPSSKIFSMDAAEFCCPGSYRFAYSAMNSLRYLDDHFSLRRHFRSMRLTLGVGGEYLIGLSITGQINNGSRKSWSFVHEGVNGTASWDRVGCDIGAEIIYENVKIILGEEIAVHEIQSQISITPESLRMAMNGYFYPAKIYTENFCESNEIVKLSTNWILLRAV